MGEKQNNQEEENILKEFVINSSVLNKCREACFVFHNGDPVKALRIIDEACLYNENSALLHRIRAEISFHLISVNKDFSDRKNYFFKAIESAQKASMLSPSSIAFAYFYARLLYSVGSHGQAIQECGRALAILNPVDPDKERSCLGGIIDSSQTPEARISNMQQSLCDLVNECVRIIRNKPADQVLREETNVFHKSNPLQSVIVNTKNLMEACRNERSAMVPVEQIPENRFEGTLVVNQLKNVIAFHKERQKKIKEEKVRLLWNSMSRQEKQSFLRLNMNELLAHFHPSSNNLALKLIKEAFRFAKDHNNWKVWICSSCDMKFVDSELHFQHVMEAHLGRFSQALQSVLPSRLNSDWQSVICKGTWKPVDPSAALLILTEHSKGLTTRSHMPDKIDYHTDKSPQKHTRGPLTNEVCSDRGSLFLSHRPMSDYSHRSVLLERIRQMLEYLLRAGYLDANHVHKIKQYTMKRLGALFPGLKLSDNQLGQTHICICFLGASQLEEIVKFLDELSQFAFMLIEHKKSIIGKFLNTSPMGLENKWRIVLNGDSLCLLVGENSLRGESAPKIYTDDDASKAFIPDSGINDIEPPITDVLLRWLFTSPSSEEELKMWSDLDELRKTQEKELHQIIARNGPILFMCDEKYKLLRYREALQAIWRLLFHELTERKLTSNRAHKSFETILSMQQRQLVEESESDISETKKFTLEVIQNVLNDAQSLGFTYQPVLTSVTTDVCDLDIFDNGDLAVQIFLDQADTCIKEVMKRHGNNMELQLMKMETWIMDTVKETEKLRVRINPSAAADYREILWPLAKSCILAKLEEHLEKDETEKYKVADKGNVSQAAPKSKKRDNRGGQSKPPQKKPKNSESKSSESNVQLIVLDQETDERIFDNVGSASASADHPDSKNIAILGEDDLRQDKETQTPNGKIDESTGGNY